MLIFCSFPNLVSPSSVMNCCFPAATSWEHSHFWLEILIYFIFFTKMKWNVCLFVLFSLFFMFSLPFSVCLGCADSLQRPPVHILFVDVHFFVNLVVFFLSSYKFFVFLSFLQQYYFFCLFVLLTCSAAWWHVWACRGWTELDKEQNPDGHCRWQGGFGKVHPPDRHILFF